MLTWRANIVIYLVGELFISGSLEESRKAEKGVS